LNCKKINEKKNKFKLTQKFLKKKKEKNKFKINIFLYFSKNKKKKRFSKKEKIGTTLRGSFPFLTKDKTLCSNP
jgi:hypothetical protein